MAYALLGWELWWKPWLRYRNLYFQKKSYKHLKILRLVNVGGSDEGARTICIYMKKAQTIEYLALVKEGIGLLGNKNLLIIGCGFIGQALHPL